MNLPILKIENSDLDEAFFAFGQFINTKPITS